MADKAGFARLVQEWIDAWNSHDIDRILALYDDDFVMSSPLIIERMGEQSGTLRGKEKIREYWSIGLSASPPLQFELLDYFVGVDSVCIRYHSVGRKTAAEVLILNEEGKILRGIAHHLASSQDEKIPQSSSP